jgi:hypothetical protein
MWPLRARLTRLKYDECGRLLDECGNTISVKDARRIPLARRATIAAGKGDAGSIVYATSIHRGKIFRLPMRRVVIRDAVLLRLLSAYCDHRLADEVALYRGMRLDVICC